MKIMRLDKYMADLQLGTRSNVRTLIRRGQVTVNGNIIKQPEYKIDEDNDIVDFNGRRLVYSRYKYYMLYKPSGVVTASASKDASETTVMDILPSDIGRNLSPVGRLDKDSEGLLLITNDGELAHRLLSPKKHVFKTYYAECDGIITQEKLLALERGVDIGDEKPTLPAKAKLLESYDNGYKIELSISEGRFHQIKRMIEAVGGKVTYLKRLSMGNLKLDETLKKGEFRELSAEELQILEKTMN